MKDRSARGLSLSDAEYEGNTSGWQAVDYKVFVKKDKVEELTAGGIYTPQDLRDQEMWNVSTGVIISHGELAFTQGRKDTGELIYWQLKPKEGDKVMVKELTGMRFTGDDTDDYLVYTDKDIVGIKI